MTDFSPSAKSIMKPPDTQSMQVPKGPTSVPQVPQASKGSSSQLNHLRLETLKSRFDLLHSTQKTQKTIYHSYVFWSIILVTFIIFFITKYLYINSKYKYIISQMTTAISQGSAFPISPFFVALSLEYPFLSSLRIGNPSLPLAISYAYTSSTIAPTMGTGYDATCKPPRDYLEEMYQVSQNCGFRMTDSGQCSALFIVCGIFRNCDKEDCFPPCPTGSDGSNAAYKWTSGVAGPAATWSMAGSMLGPVGALVGGVAGAIFGAISTNAAVKRRKKQCKQIESNCYLPPGSKFDCPVQQ